MLLSKQWSKHNFKIFKFFLSYHLSSLLFALAESREFLFIYLGAFHDHAWPWFTTLLHLYLCYHNYMDAMPTLGPEVRSAQPNTYSNAKGMVILQKKYWALFSEPERMGTGEAKIVYVY